MMRYLLSAVAVALWASHALASEFTVSPGFLVTVHAALPSVTPAPGVVPFDTDYGAAARRAVREGLPLYVWVAYKCPSSANQIPEAVHVFLSEFEGSDEQRVVVGLPNGSGWLDEAGVVQAEDCCATALRAVVSRRQAMRSSRSAGGSWGGSSGMVGMRQQPAMRSGRTAHRGGACAT